MIKLACLEKDVPTLKTPYCDISITDENGNNTIFAPPFIEPHQFVRTAKKSPMRYSIKI